MYIFLISTDFHKTLEIIFKIMCVYRRSLIERETRANVVAANVISGLKERMILNMFFCMVHKFWMNYMILRFYDYWLMNF